MPKKNRRKKRSLKEVSALVAELERYEMSAADLAEREGVSIGAIYQWKKRVSNLNQAPEPVELIAPANAWAAPIHHESGISLDINGVKCLVQPGFDQETLRRIIDVFGQGSSNYLEPC